MVSVRVTTHDLGAAYALQATTIFVSRPWNKFSVDKPPPGIWRGHREDTQLNENPTMVSAIKSSYKQKGASTITTRYFLGSIGLHPLSISLLGQLSVNGIKITRVTTARTRFLVFNQLCQASQLYRRNEGSLLSASVPDQYEGRSRFLEYLISLEG